DSEQTVCSAGRIASRREKRRKTVATTESTIETTKDCNPSSSPGGGSQAQLGPIRRVYRRKCVLRRERSAQAPVQAGRRVQAPAGRTSGQHQPAASQRRRSYQDRVTTMKPRSTHFGARENTASSRQHAPRFAVRSFPAQSAASSPASRKDAPLPPASSPQ